MSRCRNKFFEKAFASHDKKLEYFHGQYFVELHSGKINIFLYLFTLCFNGILEDVNIHRYFINIYPYIRFFCNNSILSLHW